MLLCKKTIQKQKNAGQKSGQQTLFQGPLPFHLLQLCSTVTTLVDALCGTSKTLWHSLQYCSCIIHFTSRFACFI